MLSRALMLCLFLGTGLAQICPPAAELEPCICDETLESIVCRDVRGRFDIKAVFDRASPFVNESTVFAELAIWETSLLEIPADSITTLKFRLINILFNQNLEYISPQAFRDTHAVTTELSLWNNYLNNDAPYERDIYDFFNQFVNVEKIWLPSNRITSVPDNAFTALPYLKELYLGSNNIKSIGNFAFAGLTGLEDLWISYNELSSSTVAADAFTGASSMANVDLEYNTQVTYLEEVGFKSLLTNVKSAIVGGTSCGHAGCSYEYLTCDSRADWICAQVDEFKAKLTGFLCTGDLYEDVWAYCNSLST